MCLGAGISLAKHGKEELKKENIWTTLVADAIVIALLWWGGFFDALIK